MIGIVLVTHGRLAEEFVAALEHVVGPQRRSIPFASMPTTIWMPGVGDPRAVAPSSRHGVIC